MKTILFTIVCVLLTLTLVLTIVGFRGMIAENEEVHAAQMSSLEAIVSEEIKRLESAISEMKQQNASLFREIRYEYKDLNAENGNAVLHITAYPKDVSASMTVEVGFEGTGMVEMLRHEGQFFISLDVNIFENYEPIYLMIRGEDIATGLEKTDIPTKDIWRRFLHVPPVKFTGEPKIVDGNLSLYGNFAYDKNPVEKAYATVGDIENVIIYVKRNGEIVERVYENTGDKAHGCPVEEGDVISLSAHITDSYGFTYEYVFGQYIIEEDTHLGFIKVYTYYIDKDGEPYGFDYFTVWSNTDAVLYDHQSSYAYPIT